MDPFYFVITKILVVDAIETFDIGVTLMLERCPVERRGLFNGKAVCF